MERDIRQEGLALGLPLFSRPTIGGCNVGSRCKPTFECAAIDPRMEKKRLHILKGFWLARAAPDHSSFAMAAFASHCNLSSSRRSQRTNTVITTMAIPRKTIAMPLVSN